MDNASARELAEILGGEADQAEPEAPQAWQVLIDRPDGRLVVLTDSAVEEYADRDALASGHCYACISLK